MAKIGKDFPARLRAAGITVVEHNGWYSRGRPGKFNPKGVVWHHTGSSGNGTATARWLFVTGRSDLAAPLSQFSIDRQGRVHIGARGRANHAGRSKKVGPFKAGDGNTQSYGVEVQNTGSEGYSDAQYHSMLVLGAVLHQVLGTGAAWSRGHYETSTTGKWDPGCPRSKGGVKFRNKYVLDMHAFRAELASRLTAQVPVQTKPAAKKKYPRGSIKVSYLYDARRLKRAARKSTKTRAAVVALQKAIGVLADGWYGKGTEAAIRTFQRKNGLVVDGIAGPQTVTKLGFKPV